MKELLLEEFSDIRRESDMTESILGTYFITFDRITKQMPTAGYLLRLIAFFDRQNIPEQLLRESGVEGMDGWIQFRRAISKLVGFSLLNKWSSTALGLVSRMFPEYQYELRDICQAYIPHALAVTNGRTDTIAEDLCFRMAEYFLHLGSYNSAEAQIRRCIRFREENKKQGQDKGFRRFMLLGRVSAHQGRAKEAEEILRNRP
ncbi:unnamed protein product [Tuber aestivum]|uniref:Uncharacterized protein n=1 Tax=Tuber aestivum TaxID=59557 RepID=A0A292PJH9_9PEZI|nr:unnamed protein product [Tuber aestivum]